MEMQSTLEHELDRQAMAALENALFTKQRKRLKSELNKPIKKEEKNVEDRT